MDLDFRSIQKIERNKAHFCFLWAMLVISMWNGWFWRDFPSSRQRRRLSHLTSQFSTIYIQHKKKQTKWSWLSSTIHNTKIIQKELTSHSTLECSPIPSISWIFLVFMIINYKSWECKKKINSKMRLKRQKTKKIVKWRIPSKKDFDFFA